MKKLFGSLAIIGLLVIALTGCDDNRGKDVIVEWVQIENTKLVDVQYTPKKAFAGNSSLVLEFESGLLLIYSGRYRRYEQYIIGSEYEVWKHKKTGELKVKRIK